MNVDELRRWNKYYREAERTRSTVTFETELTSAEKQYMYVVSSVRHVEGSK
jgi:hypothetical protein